MELSPTSPITSELLDSRTPLRPWQTRLLKLHSKGEENTISGDLVVVDITHVDGAVLHNRQQQVEFFALSYMWGDGPYNRRIKLNGISTDIQENLYTFLLRYRQLYHGRQHTDYIWIDAICINQLDNEEKSLQVSSMVVFYEHAKHMLVWLGEGDHFTDVAMAFVHEEMSPTGRLPIIVSYPDLDKGLHELYSTPWAGRIWVKQEVWAARDITVHCGRHAVAWGSFRDAFIQLSEQRSSIHDEWQSDDEDDSIAERPVLGSPNIKALLDMKPPATDQVKLRYADTSSLIPNRSYNGSKQDIIRLLCDAAHCESTDIRDRVYALLGMCNDRDIKADYTITATQTFTSLATHLIERESRVAAVLALDSHFGPATTDKLPLPSWTPDWRTIDRDAMDETWHAALYIKDDIPKRRLMLESILPLPPECRGSRTLAWRKSHQTFDPQSPARMYLRGIILGILPPEISTSPLDEVRIPWNPLGDMPSTSTPSTTTKDDKFRSWQRTLKSHALNILNNSPELFSIQVIRTKTSAEKPSPYHQLIAALGFPSEKYLPEHIQARQATMEDLQDLGAVGFQLFNTRSRELDLRPGDLLVVCHGCYLPLVLRRVEKRDDSQLLYTFQGVVGCSESYRLAQGEGEVPDLCDEFRIVMHAREAAGTVDTFTVV